MRDSREKILAAAREASAAAPVDAAEKQALDDDIASAIEAVTPPSDKGMRAQFAEELAKVSAEFISAVDQKDAAEKIVAIMKEVSGTELAITGEVETVSVANKVSELDHSIKTTQALDLVSEERKNRLADIPIALTKAAFAVSDMGSLVFLYDTSRTSQPYFLSDCVIVLVSSDDLVANHFDLLKIIDPQAAKNMVFVTGPSRTADIEKILILGAHGPRRLVVLLLEK